MESQAVDAAEFRDGQRQQWKKGAEGWRKRSQFIDDDLLDPRWIGRVSPALVSRRVPLVAKSRSATAASAALPLVVRLDTLRGGERAFRDARIPAGPRLRSIS